MEFFDEIMACTNSNNSYFDELGKLVCKGRVVPFVGAGMSIPFYPSWKEVLLKMISGYHDFKKVENLLNDDKYEEAATLVQEALGKPGFDCWFTNEFAPDKLSDATFRESQKVLPLLFNGMVVTTNYDKVLETVYDRQFTYVLTPSMHTFPKSIVEKGIREDHHFLIKLHGDVSDIFSRVLTQDEYEKFYGPLKNCLDENGHINFDKGSYLEMLSDMLKHSSFLFLGCSLLSDRHLELLQLQANESSPHNFAFLEMPDTSDAEKQLAFDKRRKDLADQSILAIWYPTGKHEESLSSLLQELLKRKHDYSSHNKTQAISEENTSVVDIINIAFDTSLTDEDIHQIVEFLRKIDVYNTDHIAFFAEDVLRKVDEYFKLLEQELSSLLENDAIQSKKVLYREIKALLRCCCFSKVFEKRLYKFYLSENKEMLDDSPLQTWCLKLLKARAGVEIYEEKLQKSNNEIAMYMIALQLAMRRENGQTNFEALLPNEGAVPKRMDLLYNEKAKLVDKIKKIKKLINVIASTTICVEQEIRQVRLLRTTTFSKPKGNERLMKNYVDAYNDSNNHFGQLTELIGESI